MLRTILAGALASGALLAGGGAHAQAYGGGYGGGYGAGVGVGGAPAYAGDGYGYEPYRPRGFTLAGVRAGVTVLGVDFDGSAKLTIGARDWGRGGGGYAPAPEPAYPPAPQAYPQPMEPPPGYWMGYSAPMNCGCAPPPPPCCGYGGY